MLQINMIQDANKYLNILEINQHHAHAKSSHTRFTFFFVPFFNALTPIPYCNIFQCHPYQIIYNLQ